MILRTNISKDHSLRSYSLIHCSSVCHICITSPRHPLWCQSIFQPRNSFHHAPNCQWLVNDYAIYSLGHKLGTTKFEMDIFVLHRVFFLLKYIHVCLIKSDSTHHFFRNACTKSGSLRFSQFPFVDWVYLFICLWVLTFPLKYCSECGNFVITLIIHKHILRI
jgi:hypothetical protein